MAGHGKGGTQHSQAKRVQSTRNSEEHRYERWGVTRQRLGGGVEAETVSDYRRMFACHVIRGRSGKKMHDSLPSVIGRRLAAPGRKAVQIVPQAMMRLFQHLNHNALWEILAGLSESPRWRLLTGLWRGEETNSWTECSAIYRQSPSKGPIYGQFVLTNGQP